MTAAPKTPEDLVEQVARALWDDDRDEDEEPWGDASERAKDTFRRQARAAIAVMRNLLRPELTGKEPGSRHLPPSTEASNAPAGWDAQQRTPEDLVELWKQGRRYDGSFFEPGTLLDSALAELFREARAAAIEEAARVADAEGLAWASTSYRVANVCAKVGCAIRALGEESARESKEAPTLPPEPPIAGDGARPSGAAERG